MALGTFGRRLSRLAGDVFLPRRPDGKIALGELAFDFLPDAAFAIASGVNAPAGWKAALVGEDLALGVGGSLVGRLAGEIAGRKLFGLDPTNPAHRDRLRDLRIGTSMVTTMGPALLGFRPITQKMIESETQKAEEQQLMAAEEQAQHLREQMIGAGITGLGMAARGPWETLGGLQPGPL